jgi:hypothetical protein
MNFLCENQKSWYLGPSGRKRSWPHERLPAREKQDKIFALEGQRNTLKRLDSDKRIQGNPALFL